MKATPHAAALVFAFAPVVFFVAQANGDTMVATSATSDGGDKRAELIAVKIRDQGYYCDAPQSAERERERSSPNETVWILKCMNATYRVKLIPDLAARVEHLN